MSLVTIEKLKELLKALEEAKIQYIVIGGFGLDGYRGKLTRAHQDVDIICLKSDKRKITKIVSDLDYKGKWYNDLYKINRADGSKADIAMATQEGKELVTYGRIAITRFPFSLFKPKTGKIRDFKFNIAPNELMKTFALHALNQKDKKYAQKMKASPAIMKRIQRVLRIPAQTSAQHQNHG